VVCTQPAPFPGCRVRYSRTKRHHVVWWRNGGMTDLDNLLPVCEIHHQKIHKGGWVLTLTPNRQLTIELPDGEVMTTGPPQRGAR
jgi:HNH endonuclease